MRTTPSTLALSIAMASLGCTGTVDETPAMIEPPPGEPWIEPGTVAPSLEIIEPIGGTAFARDSVSGHTWVAEVIVRARATGVARVVYETETRRRLGVADAAPWERVIHFVGEGARTIVARGLDAEGNLVAEDDVKVEVDPPTDSSCHAMLDALGLDWRPAAATMGIADPVRVQGVINDVGFRYYSYDAPTAMLMDCSFAPRLAEFADVVKELGIDEIIHVGIYNYRCVRDDTPGGECVLSQHSFGRAIDINSLGVAGSGARYRVLADWEKSSATCPGPRGTSEADQTLHDVVCTLWDDEIFNVLLTPNYNDVHANHFQFDITPDGHFLRDSVGGVDPLLPDLDD